MSPGVSPQAKLSQLQVPLAKIIPIQKLIQLSQSDLISHIEKTITENPFLEKPEITSSVVDMGSSVSSLGNFGNAGGTGIGERGDRGNVLEEINADTSQSLTGNLLEQIKWLNLSAMEEKIALALISLIDQEGFLSDESMASLQEVVGEFANNRANNDREGVDNVYQSENEKSTTKNTLNLPAEEEVMRVLELLQRELDPPGIMARSLPEALIIMLRRKGYDEEDLAVQILKEGFHLLAEKNYPALKKQLGVPTRKIKAAVQVINTLDPYPLRTLGSFTNQNPMNVAAVNNSPSGPQAEIILPDVIVREREGVLEVEVNNAYIPQVRLLKDLMNKTIKSVLKNNTDANAQKNVRDVRNATDVRNTRDAEQEKNGTEGINELNSSDNDSTAGRDFLLAKKNEALNLMNAISFRASNLKLVMDYLVKAQYDFFIHGFQKLKPMRIIDLAAELGVDKASISRLVNRKYVATYWGTFALREMFSLPVEVGRGEPVSPKEIQAKIMQLLNEFKDTKISDEKIAFMLGEMGYKIARRTVNKYRKFITMGYR